MNKAAAALGVNSAADGTCLAVDPAKLSAEERIRLLEEQMKHMQRVIIKLRKNQYADPKLPSPDEGTNKGWYSNWNCLLRRHREITVSILSYG